jgi:hypothetical protein
MEFQVVLGIAAVAALVLIRHLAMRRVAARQGHFIWLAFIPTLIGALVISWASVQVFAQVPLVGAFTGIFGVIYLTALVRMLARISRGVTSAGSQEDLVTAVTEPFVEFMGAWVGLLLIGGLVAVAALIVWGVSRSAR